VEGLARKKSCNVVKKAYSITTSRVVTYGLVSGFYWDRRVVIPRCFLFKTHRNCVSDPTPTCAGKLNNRHSFWCRGGRRYL
jgi:hypothetical protein